MKNIKLVLMVFGFLGVGAVWANDVCVVGYTGPDRNGHQLQAHIIQCNHEYGTPGTPKYETGVRQNMAGTNKSNHEGCVRRRISDCRNAVRVAAEKAAQ